MAGIALFVRTSLIALGLSPLGLVHAQAQPAPPAATGAADTRSVSQAALRSALEVDDFTAATQRALEVVTATESRFGQDARELIVPLTNLGTVALRRRDWTAAESAYQRAIALAENQRTGIDPLLSRPLHGLGEVRLAQGQTAEAVVLLKRAVDLSRNLDGLYNAAQTDIVDALIEAYLSVGNLADAEREQQFLLRVAETSFGKRDLRLLEPLDRYARWFEFVGRYSTARGLHARALQIAEQLSPDKPAVGVPALRGLSRTWFLEALYGPEVEPDPTAVMNDNPASLMQSGFSQRMSSEGERALRMALEILARTQPGDLRTRGETLAQLGDWYLISGNSTRMTRHYIEAWQLLDSAGNGARALLEQPRLLYYKPTPMSVTRFTPNDPSAYTVSRVELKLTVGRDGKVTDAVVVASDAPDATQRSVIAAVKRARYAPRLVDGTVADTTEIPLTETVYVRTSTPAPQG